MRRVAKLTSKGQLTLPVDIRRALGVREGDHLVLDLQNGDVRLRPQKSEPESRFEKYRGIGFGGLRGRKAIQRWIREIRGDL